MKKLFEDVKFPLRLPSKFEFQPMNNSWSLVEDEYMLCIAIREGEKAPRFALYKWKKENNPKNIEGYCYVNVDSPLGTSLFYPDDSIQDDNMIYLKTPNGK